MPLAWRSSSTKSSLSARSPAVGLRIIAVDDWVWVHSNFLNIFNDDPEDTGIAGADIFKMDAEGKAVERWEVLQLVGTPDNAAPWLGENISPANTNGVL